MTRDEVSSFICNKIGVTDATSVNRCNDFVQRRFQMIYDSELWRDTLKLVTGLTVDTTGIFNFPASIDRVIAIRSTGDHMLEPVDSHFLVRFDPTVFERTGDPLAFEEYADSSASYAKKIRVWPVPAASNSPVAIVLVGKMSCPTLAGVDSPSTYLRGIDNCLIAYAQGDILQRLRQYAKADKLYEEAGALLQQMRDVENRQSARQQVIVPDVDPYDSPDWTADAWIVSKV